jgi:hypothetical protein
VKRRVGGSATAWFVRVVVVVALAAVWFLAPFDTGDRQTDTASISSYDAAMALSREGDLRTTETIQVEMPPGKRGIFRIFDTDDPRRSNVDHPVDVVSVERDGAPEPYVRVDGSAGTDTIRIGSENVYLDAGTHVYRIESTTSDVFEPGDEGETLWWWDVVGSGWQMPIAQASVTAELPAEPLRAECVQGEDDPCTVTVEGTTMTVSTAGLAPFTPVTVRVAFDEDDVATPVAGTAGRDRILGLLAAAAGALVAAGLWWPTRERAPGFPVLFEPPFMVPPALGVRVLDEQDAEADLQATLFDLAERGVLSLRGGDDTWYVEVAQPLEAEHLHPAEQALLNGLGLRQVGDVFVVSSTESSGRVVSSARAALRSQVAASSSGYLRSSAPGVALRVLGWISLAATLFMVGRYFLGQGWVRWPLLAGAGAFALVAAGAMFRPGLTTVRTAEGRDLWSRTGGFARFLTTDSSESRFDAAAHMDWYPRYLAWAIALGVGDEWARRYEAQGVAVPEVPWIVWTGTGTHFHPGSMSRSFDGAIASASAAYAAAEAARSSSSGGGGGFSGGSGGGGGGGGSW